MNLHYLLSLTIFHTCTVFFFPWNIKVVQTRNVAGNSSTWLMKTWPWKRGQLCIKCIRNGLHLGLFLTQSCKTYRILPWCFLEGEESRTGLEWLRVNEMFCCWLNNGAFHLSSKWESPSSLKELLTGTPTRVSMRWETGEAHPWFIPSSDMPLPREMDRTSIP